MVPAPPPLPMRFPCWVRAVYSWGGESKRDLGFVEGDLIECLNAGDGSWWTGRLWRDRRAIGLFPSNFVEVLPESFRPMSRSTSPLPSSNTPSPKTNPQKSRTFRKPFEAYAKAPHYTTAKVPETYKSPPPARSRENSASSFHHVHEAANPAPSPPQHRGFGSRAPSPAPSVGHHQPQQIQPYRASIDAGPPPPHQQVFPRLLEGPDSPPPPPPPPHRHALVGRHGSNASYDGRVPEHLDRHNSAASYDGRLVQHASRNNSTASYDGRVPEHVSRHNSNASYGHRSTGYHTPRMPSPAPAPSPGAGEAEGLTPSPLREAMDDVMEQLDALGAPRQAESPEPPFDPWSPESFDMLRHRSKKKNELVRPSTAMGIPQHPDEGYETYSGSGNSSRDQTYHGHFGDQQLQQHSQLQLQLQPQQQLQLHQQAAHRQQELQLQHHPMQLQQVPQLSNYVERMETRLRNMQQHHGGGVAGEDEAGPPTPPPKNNALYGRPKSSMGMREAAAAGSDRKLRHKKSAYDVGRNVIGRTFTTKTNSTSASSGTRSTATESTDRSLMSGTSAGGVSATSAGSLARKNRTRAQSALVLRDVAVDGVERPETPFTGVTYRSSHASGLSRPKSQAGLNNASEEPIGSGLGGLVQPKAKKQNFIKRILESAKTGVASTRGSIATAGMGSVSSSPMSRPPMLSNNSSNNIVGNSNIGSPRAIMGGGGGGGGAVGSANGNSGIDWVQVRRDVNRSNSLSRNERNDRRDRCHMMDYPAMDPVAELYTSTDGDEGADGLPVAEAIDYLNIDLGRVDKNSRFVSSLPPMTTAVTLATTYVCRPYRSDVQRLRAIFTWVAEKICWEEDFEGDMDTRRVIQTKRACGEEYAALVLEMCVAVGVRCEAVRGYLKTPGEVPETGLRPRPNHWWNAVVVDGAWRVLDCCLASPSNPRRALYSSAGSAAADPWWFLARPAEVCWTHIPEHPQQQHLCPPVAPDVLLSLPCACPPYFRNGLRVADYDTSLTRIEDLEMVHVKLDVPPDVEVAAEVEVRALARDPDGDYFESGDTVRKRALAQAEWFAGTKRYTVKALLPGDEGVGVLRVYAGKRGLMQSIKDIPHPLAMALPVIHAGENPPYEFVTRHPTPHAQRHDIYVVQPQCQRLALNNTFVFAVRQHPSSPTPGVGDPGVTSPLSGPGGASPIPFARPGSALSMTSSSAAGSNPSTSASGSGSSGGGATKPAKLAIQTPGGKILRLMRKEERRGISNGVARAGGGGDDEVSDGGTWETIIKCSERGVWRGLVLADRTARWCVFAEWVCVG